MLEKVMCDPQFSCEEWKGEGLEHAFEAGSTETTGLGWGLSGSRPVCLLTSAGLLPGPLCEQHMGLREGHVPCQPFRPVLLPARLSTDTDSHCREPPPGEGTCPKRPVLLSLPWSSRGVWGP